MLSGSNVVSISNPVSAVNHSQNMTFNVPVTMPDTPGDYSVVYSVAFDGTNVSYDIEQFDLNNDGILDANDTGILLSYYGTYVNYNDPISVACDFNHDGKINSLDYSTWGNAYHNFLNSLYNGGTITVEPGVFDLMNTQTYYPAGTYQSGSYYQNTTGKPQYITVRVALGDPTFVSNPSLQVQGDIQIYTGPTSFTTYPNNIVQEQHTLDPVMGSTSVPAYFFGDLSFIVLPTYWWFLLLNQRARIYQFVILN
jgi:hypothetical protein